MTSRRVRVATLVAALLAAAAMLPGAAQARHRPAGVMRDLGARATRLERARLADVFRLPYGGGPVLHWNRTHLIFWQPRGSGLTFDPGYQALIKTFLRNVAAASRSWTSVYGLTGQYRDQNGPAANVSIFGGAVTATNHLPANGCQEPAPPTGPGWTRCLTDQQLQQEIERVVSRDRLPTTANDLYFLVMPDGLGDCAYTGSNSCALGGEVDGYCGYHSQTPDFPLVLYAVVPYNALPGHCQSENPRPNGSAADPAISTISHEQSEMVTDPLGNAWIVSDPTSPYWGEEDGDLCLTSFGPNIGGSGNTAWNEEINGGRYYLQEEWSNHSGGCAPRARPDSISFRAGPRAGDPLSPWFAGQAHDPQARIVSYRWFFGDGRTVVGRRTVHRYARSGQYRVVLRTMDSWGNWAFYAATLTVSRAGVRVAPATNAG